MVQKFSNQARSELAAAISDSDTTLQLKSGDGALFPVADTGAAPINDDGAWFKVVIDSADGFEIAYVRSHSADQDTLTHVLRGQEGTTARAFAIGDVIGLRMTALDAEAWSNGGTDIGYLPYAERNTLRTTTAKDGDVYLVDGLGLFRFALASDEPDDDESCFATGTGRWLLQAAHWDLVDAWQLPEQEAALAWEEDEALRFSSKVLTGSATCAITSVVAVSSASFTGTVTGAKVGDSVLVTPPAQLGATAAETGRLSYHAWVSGENTVTIMLTNASAGNATTNTAIQAAWPITVIKA